MDVEAGMKAAKSSDAHTHPLTWSGRSHLIDTKDLTLEEFTFLLGLARKYKDELISGLPLSPVLRGWTVANLFYENSTRTRCSFELASKHLGMNVLNLDLAVSSVKKGETLEDTARTLTAMGVRAMVQRHATSGSAQTLADTVGPKVHVVNAGDGTNAHPTQALLDAFTMLEFVETLRGRKVAIIGDITHSRVARSNLWLLKKLGAEVHFAGPPKLLPESDLGAEVHERVEDAIKDADFVMALRIQLERQQSGLVPSLEEYVEHYRINHERLKLAKPHVKVLHPGPINRGVEITDAVADDADISLIERQVANGVPIRMSVMHALCLGK